jgi:chloramphenicol-sensitive protein RarD
VRPSRTGVLAGLAAYGMWGVFPLYFPLLRPASAVEILCHRIVWSFVVMIAVTAAAGHMTPWRVLASNVRRARMIAIAAIALATNWGVYVWAVDNDHVVDASLGYFVNPLLTVALGVVVLHERLTRLQQVALGFGATAVLVLSVGYGSVPWIALVLASSFGAYGFLKKSIGLDGIESLAGECAVLVVPALVVLAVLATTSGLSFGDGAGHSATLMSTGLVTVFPLVLFGVAATRVPLSTVGLMQYLTPTLQFLCGVFAFDESVPAPRLAGFVLVWIALAILVVDGLRTLRRASEPSAGSIEPLGTRPVRHADGQRQA